MAIASWTTIPANESCTEEHAALPQNPSPSMVTVVPTVPADGLTVRVGDA